MSVKSKVISVGRLLYIGLLKLQGNHIQADHTSKLRKSNLIARFGEIQIGRNVSLRPNSTLEATDGGRIQLMGHNFINRNCVISAKKMIKIEEGVTIGPGTYIYDHDHNHNDMDYGKFICDTITVEKNVWIGSGCIILKGCTIGEGSVIAAGSIITKDVPAHTIVYNRVENLYKPINGTI